VQVASGDTLALGPAAGTFPDGVGTVYLLDGSSRVARVDFVSGLVSITVAPAAGSLPRGAAQGFTASGTFSDTRVADITAQVSWASSQPAIASVDAATGRVQALQAGSTTITARSGSITASTSLTVTAAALLALELSPTDPAGGVGTSTLLRGQGRYTDNSVADLSALIVWSSSNPAVATVGSGIGLVSALAVGTTTLTASVGAISASTTFTVSAYSGRFAASLATPRSGHTATRLLDGRVLVAGGSSSGTPLASVEIYDPDADRWAVTTPMIGARRFHQALLLPDGRVLVLGGLGADNGLLATAELYQPATQTWTAVPVSGLAGVILGASLLADGDVLVTGGVGFDPVRTSAAVYTPGTGAWVTVPGLPDDGSPTFNTNRHGHNYVSVSLPSGRVLVLGGRWDIEYSSNATTVYDALSRTWTAAAPIARASGYRSTATLMPNGEVIMTGGSDADFPTSYWRSTGRYDPVLNRWSDSGDLAQARADHSATLMPDGSLLVAGGFDSNSTLGSVERLAPNASSWAAAGSLLHPRGGHTATLLGNGKVLVVGGITPGGLTGTCELRW
jgi:Bacterial Ig-like domain (group 2)/Kelch motif/Galactose oxidase, central domain